MEANLTTSKDNPGADQIADVDLEVVRGGAWSLGLRDGSIRDLIPDNDSSGAGVSPTADLEARGFNPQPEPPAKSKLLHK